MFRLLGSWACRAKAAPRICRPKNPLELSRSVSYLGAAKKAPPSKPSITNRTPGIPLSARSSKLLALIGLVTAMQPCAAPAVLGSDLADEQPESPTCAGSSEILYGPYKACAGEGWSVRIRQSKRGFRSQALIDCVLPIAPDQAYDLLTDPEVKEWRQVKECTYRRVWEDDGNRQLVEVEQTSTVFFKTIHTRMHVTQDRRAGTMRFSLAKPGMLRMCNGQWTVSAVPGEGGCAKVHLEQEMQPAFVPPPPFKRFLRRAMLSKAAAMLHQMQEEAVRIREGCAAAAATKLSGARSLGAIELTAWAAGGTHIRPEPYEEGHQEQRTPDMDPCVASHQLEFDSESEC